MAVRLLMLASSSHGGAAVELASGSLVRVHWADLAPRFAPYDLVEGQRTIDEKAAFAPDSLVVRQPALAGRLRGRKAERIIRPLVQPPNTPLLGAPGPTVPFWTLRGDQPSVAVVAPAAGPVVERDWAHRLHCRFRWQRIDHDLPLDDPRVEERLTHPTATRLAGATLARALGWKPVRILVALTPPKDGMCHKVVGGLLPRA